jgi:thiamine-phosphate pyrophosphorylase
MKPALRPGLYAIVDPEHTGGRDPVGVARAVLRGGCALLQLRAKGLRDRELLELARAVRQECAGAGVPFIVNDRADVALLAGADGVHLGQDDLPVVAAQRLLGPDALLGISTHDVGQATEAFRLPVDLIAYGPVFATRTKERPDPIVGLTALAAVTQASPVPVVAIGGITEATAAEVYQAGATWVAAISALGEAPDPEAAAHSLHTASVERARR